MSVLSLSRDWGVNPAIVRMTVTDTLATITTPGYLTGTAIAAEIEALNTGAFDWLNSDLVLINYDVSWGFFKRVVADNDFVAVAIPGALANTLTSGRILVGSVGNVATGVAMSGDASIIASGALTIAANAVTSAKTAANLIQYTTVAITAAQFNGMFAAPKLLLAAPGANKLIVVERMVLAMTFVSANYANGGVVAAQYDSVINGGGQHATNVEAAADFFAAASSAFMFVGNSGNASSTDGGLVPFAANVDKGLYLSNKTGAFTTGDSTWIAHLWYRIMPTV